jgi:hypothetical protein
MRKITEIYYLAILCVLLVVPASAWAAINTVYDAKEKARQVASSVQNSPVYGMALYTFGAIGAFVALIVIVFLLIMLLKR